MPWFSAHQMAQQASEFYKNTLLKETGFRKVSERLYCYKPPHTQAIQNNVREPLLRWEQHHPQPLDADICQVQC